MYYQNFLLINILDLKQYIFYSLLVFFEFSFQDILKELNFLLKNLLLFEGPPVDMA